MEVEPERQSGKKRGVSRHKPRLSFQTKQPMRNCIYINYGSLAVFIYAVKNWKPVETGSVLQNVT
ncbi:hypothetical protein A3860_21350 [Niastella vici]|uniref:Uncharacterized protein n=1 Tax=Niastella vici TaxID=1703345 RepID=A0A1V9G030_9BACT|nr:hypothetical protein A3860_21350 [Niastella vici]